MFKKKITQEEIHAIADRKLSKLDKEISYVREELENEPNFEKKMRKYNYLAGLEYARLVASHLVLDIDEAIKNR